MEDIYLMHQRPNLRQSAAKRLTSNIHGISESVWSRLGNGQGWFMIVVVRDGNPDGAVSANGLTAQKVFGEKGPYLKGPGVVMLF
jgi:hypothetical protein